MTIKSLLTASAASISLLLAGSNAMAADLAPQLIQISPTFVDTYQPFQIRLSATAIIPHGGTNVYDTYGKILPLVDMSAGPGGHIFGAGARVSDNVIPELDLAYFFNKNIAVELMCCVTRHHISGKGSLQNLDIGSTWAFPPTLFLQYHVTEFGRFQPYVGVGVNYTAFFNTNPGRANSAFNTPVGYVGSNQITNLSISGSWGVAGQVGFDYMINENLGLNLNVKRILMEPKAYLTVWNNAVSPVLGPIPVRAKVNIDPWLASVGLTYRFGGQSAPSVVARY